MCNSSLHRSELASKQQEKKDYTTRRGLRNAIPRPQAHVYTCSLLTAAAIRCTRLRLERTLHANNKKKKNYTIGVD